MWERRAVARELVAAPPDRLDIYFTRRLRRRVTLAEDLYGDDIQDALRHWAWWVRCGISDVEYVHVRNHRRAHAGQSWQAFAAAHINAEARMAHEEANAKVATNRSTSLSLVADAAPARATPKVRKLTPRAAFRASWFAQQKSLTKLRRRCRPVRAKRGVAWWPKREDPKSCVFGP